MKLVLITGMSGAGKSVALKTLEDSGFEAVDNIPLSLLDALVSTGNRQRPLAIGIDIRSRDFADAQLMQTIEALRHNAALELTVLYLDADDDVLQRRYTETRRTHPLALDRSVLDGIHLERQLLSPIKPLADEVVDTSELLASDLKRLISGKLAAEVKHLHVDIVSFSFKQGLPREADTILDVRFLKNPHYVEELRDFTGQNPEVGQYIEADDHFSGFFDRVVALLLPLLPRYRDEGKSYFTIAIGCTGGKHRSVFVAEKLAKTIVAEAFPVTVRHRDMPQTSS